MAFNNVVAIAYDLVQDRLVGVEAVFQDQFLEIDAATGQATILNTLSGLGSTTHTHLLGLAFAPSDPVPKPSTMLLLSSGLVGLAAWRGYRAHRERTR